jgi:hypothetical protein
MTPDWLPMEAIQKFGAMALDSLLPTRTKYIIVLENEINLFLRQV